MSILNIPLMIETVVNFDLYRIHNNATVANSACDAFHEAILLITEAREIKLQQYRIFKKAYEDAKALGMFVSNYNS